ncbi:hypothetical protein K437DRAFT_267893 [Tilletiaria anomala UBC 951]|uniref:Uncharacterized protein n=1 Tax=Tilletiaria anomala (strain ATCC 24038 / CBS 436.72 / UBC 951) TaxID=1037660 RepID=A0A066W4B1_TILAU|nr:uncharacterized protein K437DRAFT_267893 [Tilletiaria anomala UBC 951]KDN47353.1 hypothetical protein K437DRAFT_267893 [Tilletiaria anomala UBC 951]
MSVASTLSAAHEQALQAGLLPPWHPPSPSDSPSPSFSLSTERNSVIGSSRSSSSQASANKVVATFNSHMGAVPTGKRQAPPPPLDLSHPLHHTNSSSAAPQARRGYCFCGNLIPSARARTSAGTSDMQRHGSIDSTPDSAYSHGSTSTSSDDTAPRTPADALPTVALATSKHLHSNKHMRALQLQQYEQASLENAIEQDEEEHEVVEADEGEEEEDDEESRIYCSSACARSDALSALLGGQEPAAAPVCAFISAASKAFSISTVPVTPTSPPPSFAASLTQSKGQQQQKQMKKTACPGAPARTRALPAAVPSATAAVPASGSHERKQAAANMLSKLSRSASSSVADASMPRPLQRTRTGAMAAAGAVEAEAQSGDGSSGVKEMSDVEQQRRERILQRASRTIQDRYPLLINCLQLHEQLLPSSSLSATAAAAPEAASAQLAAPSAERVHAPGHVAESPWEATGVVAARSAGNRADDAEQQHDKPAHAHRFGSSHYRRMEALASYASQLHDIIGSVYASEEDVDCQQPQQPWPQCEGKQKAAEKEHGRSARPDSPALKTFSFGCNAGRAFEDETHLADSVPTVKMARRTSSRKVSHVPMESTSSQSSNSTQQSDVSDASAYSASTAGTSVDLQHHLRSQPHQGEAQDYRPSRHSLEESKLELEREARLRKELQSLDHELKKTFDAFEFDEHRSSDEDDERTCGPYTSPLGWGLADSLLTHLPSSADWKHTTFALQQQAVQQQQIRHSRSMGNLLGLQLGSPAPDARASMAAFPEHHQQQLLRRSESVRCSKRISTAQRLDLLATPPAPVQKQKEEYESQQQAQPRLAEGSLSERRDTFIPTYPVSRKARQPVSFALPAATAAAAPAASASHTIFSANPISAAQNSNNNSNSVQFPLRASRSMSSLKGGLGRLGRRPAPASRQDEELQALRLVQRLDTVFKSSWGQIRGVLGMQQNA